MSELYIRLGKALKAERQNKNVSIADIAAILKTPESTLERIEEGDIASFQSKIYFNLHAKSYAEALGVDYGRTVDAIREDLGELNDVPANGPAAPEGANPPAPETAAPSPESRARTNTVWVAIVAGAFVIAIALAIWWIASGNNESATATAPQKLPATTETFSNPVDTTAGVASQDTALVSLSLVARGSSWVSLMTDGDTAIYRTFLPGESLEVAAQRQMILTVSSPANIDFKLNGIPAKLADRSGRISNIVVTPANFRAFTGGVPTLIVDSVQLDSANAKSIETPAQPNAEKSGAGGTGR